MRSIAAMILLAGCVLLALAPPAGAVVPVYYANALTWTPASPVVGQTVTFGLSPSFMASIGASTWDLKNMTLNYGGAYREPPYVFSTAGHYDMESWILFGTSYPFDDDGPGPNIAGYVHVFITDVSLDVLPLPEPSSLLALACGIGALGGMIRLRRR